MAIFNKIFPFVIKEFGDNVIIDSVDGQQGIEAIAYFKNKSISSESFFNDKILYCNLDLKVGDIINYDNISYMCVRQVSKYEDYWVTNVRQCDFVTKFVVGTEIKIADSFYMSQSFKISEGLDVVSSDSTVICVIPHYAWTDNLDINQEFVQFGFKWRISGIDKTKDGLVYLHANRGDKATDTENGSGIIDGSEIYATQILWDEFPGYLEANNKYPIKATIYKQNPDLTWVPTLEKVVYRSSDSSVAYVDEAELLNCVKAGKARIYAEYLNDFSKSIYRDIEVNEEFIDYRMEWTNSVTNMYTDDVYKFTAQVFKNDIAITVPVLYEIAEDYKEIAELGINGTVTAKKPGTFIITATWLDNPNYSISKQVTVSESTYSVKFYKYTNKLKLNNKTSFLANVYKNGIIDASKSIRYSSDNLSSVQINPNTGEVNPVGLGKAKIRASMVDNLSVYEEIDVEVFEVVYSIIWKKQITGAIFLGREYSIEAVVGVDLEPDLSKPVGYRSSNDAIVTVDSSGNVTPISIGQAELTAYYVDDESVKDTLLVNVESNEYTIEWINPESAAKKFCAGGDYSNFDSRIDLGVIVKRDGVDVTSEYKWEDLYHFKEGDQYTSYAWNGRYIDGGGSHTFRQVSVTISIPNVPNSPTLTWEGAILPVSNGDPVNYQIASSGQIQIIPDTSLRENGIVLNQDTLLSTDIMFACGDLKTLIDEGVNYRYEFRYSDVYTEGALVQRYRQNSSGEWYPDSKQELPFYIKSFFETYPDVIYPVAVSTQPEVITATNTPKQHFAYLRGNYISKVQVYQSINNYSNHKTYQYRSYVNVKQPNGIGIYMTYGKKIYTNQHNGIMAYATLNGRRLDDEGMVFEIQNSNNTQIELRKFPKVVTGHFASGGKPNVIKSILNTDDGWSAFSDSYLQRMLSFETSGYYNHVNICMYPYNRQKVPEYINDNNYFVNQSWKFERDDSGNIVYDNSMRDVFITEDISSSRNITIKAYHKDYPNFYEIREYTIYPSSGQDLRLFFGVKTNDSDELEYSGTMMPVISIDKRDDLNWSQQTTYSYSFPKEYEYITFFIADSKRVNEPYRDEDRYDYGYWHISWCKNVEARLSTAPPNIKKNYGTTNYPRQTIISINDWDTIESDRLNKNTIDLYIQPASLLVDSARYSNQGYYQSNNRQDVENEIAWQNQFPKIRNQGIEQITGDLGEIIYSTRWYNAVHPYEEHVVNDAIWIDKNYDALTDFIKLYGTKSPEAKRSYEDGNYENIDMKYPYCGDSGDIVRLWEQFMFLKVQFSST